MNITQDILDEAFEIKWNTYGFFKYLGFCFKPLCKDWFEVGVDCAGVLSEISRKKKVIVINKDKRKYINEV